MQRIRAQVLLHIPESRDRQTLIAHLDSAHGAVRKLLPPPARLMSKLPQPIACLVIQFLPFKQHAVVRTVSRAFFNAAMQPASWPSRLAFDDLFGQMPENYNDIVCAELGGGRVTALKAWYWRACQLLLPQLTRLNCDAGVELHELDEVRMSSAC